MTSEGKKKGIDQEQPASNWREDTCCALSTTMAFLCTIVWVVVFWIYTDRCLVMVEGQCAFVQDTVTLEQMPLCCGLGDDDMEKEAKDTTQCVMFTNKACWEEHGSSCFSDERVSRFVARDIFEYLPDSSVYPCYSDRTSRASVFNPCTLSKGLSASVGLLALLLWCCSIADAMRSCCKTDSERRYQVESVAICVLVFALFACVVLLAIGASQSLNGTEVKLTGVHFSHHSERDEYTAEMQSHCTVHYEWYSEVLGISGKAKVLPGSPVPASDPGFSPSSNATLWTETAWLTSADLDRFTLYSPNSVLFGSLGTFLLFLSLTCCLCFHSLWRSAVRGCLAEARDEVALEMSAAGNSFRLVTDESPGSV